MSPSTKTPDVLYIAGYGRSGSTILDVLLGTHPQVVSVGELTYFGEEWAHPDRLCACGSSYSQCSFWGNALDTEKEARMLRKQVRYVEHRRSLPRLLAGALPQEHSRGYKSWMQHLFSHASAQDVADIVVDSSKSARDAAGRVWALSEIANLDVRVLHLVRNGWAVLDSVVEKGSNWALENYRDEKSLLAGRTTVGWVLANSIACTLGKALDESRYLQIRFEDLLVSPEATLHRIGSFCGLDMEAIVNRVEREEPFPVGHNVGGNRVRHRDHLQFRQKDCSELRTGKNLGVQHRLLFGCCGEWLNRLLGYKN